jgi:uncharacterized protein (TIGR02453 family)
VSFPPETLAFLTGVAANNEKAWFEANRGLYEAGYVEPAKAFVAELGPRIKAFSPDVQFEPKINGSIARINRDIRFSKDKRPYKTHLDLWFWHGDKRSWEMPGFWFSFTPTAIYAGSGLYMFQGERLEAFRQSVIHPRSGKALAAMVERLQTAGYSVEGKTRKRMPAGFDADPSRAEFLLYEGLYCTVEMPVQAASQPGFADLVLSHFVATKPVNDWLMAEVVD